MWWHYPLANVRDKAFGADPPADLSDPLMAGAHNSARVR